MGLASFCISSCCCRRRADADDKSKTSDPPGEDDYYAPAEGRQAEGPFGGRLGLALSDSDDDGERMVMYMGRETVEVTAADSEFHASAAEMVDGIDDESLTLTEALLPGAWGSDGSNKELLRKALLAEKESAPLNF